MPKPPLQPQDLTRLGEQITELAAHLDAGEYRFLVLVGAFDRAQGWAQPGVLSCAHWLNWRCGVGLGAAREKVRVARALPELPQISRAFRAGRVSYSKVRAMTRVATPQNEDVLLNVALHGTASHVERQVRLYRQVRRREALEAANDRHANRALSCHVDDSGYWVIRGRLAPEQGALVAQALQAAMDEDFAERRGEPAAVAQEREHGRPCDQRRTEPVAQRRADALVRVAQAFLSSSNASASGGDHYLVHVHTDLDTLRAGGCGAEAGLEAGGDHCGHVSAETSRRLACDAGHVHWLENGAGEPLSVGRRTRSVPPAIRRVLRRRDGGCRFPGCTATRFVDAHHVRHWADGGETKLDNLVMLCRRHHRLLHEGGYGVALRSGGAAVFRLPDGRRIPESGGGRFRGNVAAVRQLNRREGLVIDAKTAVPLWFGEKMDSSQAVLGLIQRE